MNIIDTHSHLFADEFADDLPAVIDRAREAGVERILLPNIDRASLDDLLRVSAAYPGYCYPLLGLHPTSVTEAYRDELAYLRRRLEQPHPYVGIGEVGLDLYWDTTYRQEQMEAFDEQVQWALTYDLPLVIHCRKAFPELMTCLAPYRHTALRGIFHSFTGDDGDTARLLDFEHFLLGINGVVTFKKSVLPEVLRRDVPLDRIVLETDSPYLAPVPHRGKRNESAYVTDVLRKLADVYELAPEEVARRTTANVRRLFGESIFRPAES